jgi:phosphoribosylaminoimidazole (AIR) synthetase
MGLPILRGAGLLKIRHDASRMSKASSFIKEHGRFHRYLLFLADLGRIPEDQLYQVFNMGIGMMLIVDPKDVEEVLDYLKSHHEHPYVIGEVTDTPGVVIQ